MKAKFIVKASLIVVSLSLVEYGTNLDYVYKALIGAIAIVAINYIIDSVCIPEGGSND
jgi:uncharacterized membrane protein YvlD (DUF360 family)